MTDIRNIVWNEGMFIAPQHFQQYERMLHAYMNEVAQLDVQGNDHGLSEMEISDEHLKVGKISIQRAAGVFPDRTFFRLRLALVLDVPDGVVDTQVYLAVPLAQDGVTLVGDERGVHRLIRSRTVLRDTSNSDNEPLDAEVAEIGACLLLEGDDMSGFSAMPVAKILEKGADGRVVLDHSFIPPCLAIAGSMALTDRLDEIISLLRARAANTASRIASMRATQNSSSFLEERLELQGLNRSLFALQNALAHPYMSGRRLYGLLGELLVSLDAGRATATDPDMVYDAQAPGPAFMHIFYRLRKALTLEPEASVIPLTWNTELFEKRRLLRIIVPQKLLAEKRRPVLAVAAPDGTENLSKNVPLACKLAGISEMPELVQRGLPGVPLTPLSTAPSELRDRVDAAFFAIDTGSTYWQRFRSKREALALHVDDRIPSLDATLYMLG